jgi:hypothetical protein
MLDSKGNVVVDTKRKMATLGLDKKEFVASYPVNLKLFSVHIFYLNCEPMAPMEHYWRNVKVEEEEYLDSE